jgi:thiamine pyrophosphate-dependent acetolactate synthase large subunit-like protein
MCASFSGVPFNPPPKQAERPLIIVGKSAVWSRAEDDVGAFIERTQIPFPRSPMGKGVMPDDHPLSVAAARTLALQNADVVFLMGARFNWIFHPGFRRDRLPQGDPACAGSGNKALRSPAASGSIRGTLRGGG